MMFVVESKGLGNRSHFIAACYRDALLLFSMSARSQVVYTADDFSSI